MFYPILKCCLQIYLTEINFIFSISIDAAIKVIAKFK